MWRFHDVACCVRVGHGLVDCCCFAVPYTQLLTGKFFYIYICCFIAKSRGMSLTHVRSAIARSVFLPFTFLRQSSILPVGYRTLDVSTTAAAPTTLLLVIL